MGLNEFIEEHVKKLLTENPNKIFHCVDEKKFLNIINKNEIKPRWKHYLQSEDRIVIGTSFTWDLNHNSISNMEYPIMLVFNRELLEQNYKTYPINSNRTYLQTMSILKPDLYDPTAYELEDTEPNELFVEGTIKPLEKYLIDIKILNSVSKEIKEIIKNF